MTQSDNFCIRADYRARAEAETRIEAPEQYWNSQRIAMSGFYQYHVYEAASHLLAGMSQPHVADIGCGYPTKTDRLLAPLSGKVVLFDQPAMGQLLPTVFPHLHFEPVDLECPEVAPYADHFDLVVCSDVVEHLLAPDALMAFIRSIVKPDGYVVLSTPEREVERGKDCLSSPKAEHVREWTRSEFANYVQASGFTIERHELMPKGKLSALETRLPWLTTRWRISRYAGCQTVICRPRVDP